MTIARAQAAKQAATLKSLPRPASLKHQTRAMFQDKKPTPAITSPSLDSRLKSVVRFP